MVFPRGALELGTHPMHEDLRAIRKTIDELVRRERRLILTGIAGQASLLLLLLAVLGAFAALLSWDRGFASALLVFLGGVGLWAVVFVPLLLRWRASGDRLRQARIVESLVPDLRGRLLTAVDRTEGPVGQESAALLGLVARRVVRLVGRVPPGRVHPGRRVLLLTAVAGLAWLLAVPSSLLLPGGPKGVWRWWAASLSANAAVEAARIAGAGEVARVGDLVLRYTYPEYTGLEPREVPNSTGEAVGPPGTTVEIVARTGEPVEAAHLLAYDDPPLLAQLDDEHRQLTASFTIEKDPGTYHLVVYRDARPAPSPEFAITPEADLAPEVLLTHDGGALELALDQAFALDWRAKDDFGVRSVEVRLDGKETGMTLMRPDRRRVEVSGQLVSTPRELALRPGQRVDLTIAAWDNDTVSGSKMGTSRSVELVVLGPNGLDGRTAERQEQLRSLMLDALADFLEEPWPNGETSGDLAHWGEVVGHRYEPLEDLAEKLWGGFEVHSLEATTTRDVLEAARQLIRYTQVAFAPKDPSIAKESALEVTSDLREDALVTLEDGILALDRALRLRALRELAEQAEQVAQVGDELRKLVEKENPDAQELLARLDQLERMFDQLVQSAAQLEDGGLKELVNGRESELRSLMEEIRERIAAGDLEDARELMSRLADQLQQLSDAVQESIAQMQSEQDGGMQRAQALADELKRLEAEQRELQSRVQAMQKEQDASAAEAAAALWKRVQERAARVEQAAGQYTEGLEEADRSFFEQQRAKAAQEETQVLRGAAEARDLWGARDAAEVARAGWGSVQRGLAIERRRGVRLEGPSESELDAIQGDLAEIQRLLDQLDQLSQASEAASSPQAEELRQAQENLQRELRQAQEQASEIVREFPVRPRGMEEHLQTAEERMDQAEGDLRRGRPLPAEGAQGVAAERIREAREALEEAMKQAAQQAQQLQRPSDGQESSDGQDGQESQPNPDHRMLLPQAEDFQTPEEYRKALLEGMEADVPEQYRALKQRYYEELVSQ